MITIKKFKSVNFFDKKINSITYGIDMVTIYNESYHCLRQKGKPLIFSSQSDAINKVKEFNKALTAAIQKETKNK